MYGSSYGSDKKLPAPAPQHCTVRPFIIFLQCCRDGPPGVATFRVEQEPIFLLVGAESQR